MIVVNEATAIRAMRDEDFPFIFGSWLKSFQFSKNRRHCKKGTFARCHTPIIALLLSRSPRRLVACDPEHEGNIQGWIIGDTRDDGLPVVHYCYVREAFNGLGLERLLFNAVTGGAPRVVVSHLFTACDGTADIMFDPYSIILRSTHEEQEAT